VAQAAAPAEAAARAAAPAEGKGEPIVDVPRPVVTQLGPRQIRLHLLDGNIISGDLSVREISVETAFGKLVVPVDRIVRFAPGLDSYPQIAGQIEALVRNLGADDYKTRDQAHKDLLAMGQKVRRELERYKDDDNAEIKRRVAEILKALDEQNENLAADEAAAGEQPWIRPDTVVTTEFTVVGKIAPLEFQIASKYGPLTVKLADVKLAERETTVRESLRKSVTVDATNLVQRTFKSSGVRVQAGDKIHIQAEGSLVMSPWGNQAVSSPDGVPNFGWYLPNQIPGGALVARIGDKGQIVKVGRQLTLVAKNSGVLQFAIAMQPQFAQEGYQFPGQYEVKLRVEPK